MSRGAALAFLKGCREGMHLFGQNIALIINTILLTAVYVLGVGMTSLIAKMASRHFLAYLKVMALTAPIAVLGIAVRRLLK